MNLTILINIVTCIAIIATYLFINAWISALEARIQIHSYKLVMLEKERISYSILQQEVQDKRLWLRSFMEESVALAQENEKLKAQLGKANGKQVQEQEGRTAGS